MAIAVLEHRDAGAGGNKRLKACWAPWGRTGRVVQTQPHVGMLLVKVANPGSGGQRAFLFVFVLGDQELISSPSLGLRFLPCMVESYSCPAHVPRLFFSI